MLQRRGMMLMVKVVSMVSASAQMGRLAYILAQGGICGSSADHGGPGADGLIRVEY